MPDQHKDKVVAVGEAMVEMAPVDGGLYRRGFAGDTFNTLWHLTHLLGADYDCGYVTKVGQDALSDSFVDDLHQNGVNVAHMGRDPLRSMGLYLIQLDGVERSFHYWRSTSAARGIADDADWLAQAIAGARLIHLSGITVAILPEAGRATLLDALQTARANGATVAFDPNIRPQLWSSEDEARHTLTRFMSAADIALPSFDDEQRFFGDACPQTTIARFAAEGVGEVIVKNGADSVLVHANGATLEIATPQVTDIRDTSGAGDAFNAGYLASRLMGQFPSDAVRLGQITAARTIQHLGARLPVDVIRGLKPKQLPD